MCLKVIRSSTDQQLYNSESRTEGALVLKGFVDNSSAIYCSESNNLSYDHNVHAAFLLTWANFS